MVTPAASLDAIARGLAATGSSLYGPVYLSLPTPALNIVLENGSLRASLESADVYGLTKQSQIPGRSTDRIWSKPMASYHDLLSGYRLGNRTLSIVSNLFGTSIADWVDNQQNIEEILLMAELYWASGGQEGAKAYLYMQVGGVGAQPVVFDVMAGQLNIPNVFAQNMTVDDPPIYPEAEIILITFPMARSPLRNLVQSGTLKNGGGTTNTLDNFEVVPLDGEVQAPSKLTIKGISTYQRLLIGKKSLNKGSNFLFSLECPTGTPTGYTVTDLGTASGLVSLANVVVAAAHNAQVLRVTTLGGSGGPFQLIRVSINKNLLDFYGTYRVFLRLNAITGGDTVITAVQLRYGGTGSLISNASAVPALMTDLGTMKIPEVSIPTDHYNSAFNFELWTTVVDSGAAPFGIQDYNNIYLMPIDEEFADISLSAASSANDQLIFDLLQNLPKTYPVNSSGDLLPSIITSGAPDGRFSLSPNRSNRFYALISSGVVALDNVLTKTWSAQVEYPDLFSQFR